MNEKVAYFIKILVRVLVATVIYVVIMNLLQYCGINNKTIEFIVFCSISFFVVTNVKYKEKDN